MGHIRVIDLVAKEHSLPATPGLSVMEIIDEAGVPIKATCYGCCSCASCHVYVDPAWIDKLDSPEFEEQDILDLTEDMRDNSRLSCQIIYDDALDGLKITLTTDTKT